MSYCTLGLKTRTDEITVFFFSFFIYIRNPTHKSNPYVFKPMRRGEINFVDITNDGLVPGLDSFGDRQKFWSDLRLKYKSNLESGSIRDEL